MEVSSLFNTLRMRIMLPLFYEEHKTVHSKLPCQRRGWGKPTSHPFPLYQFNKHPYLLDNELHFRWWTFHPAIPLHSFPQSPQTLTGFTNWLLLLLHVLFVLSISTSICTSRRVSPSEAFHITIADPSWVIVHWRHWEYVDSVSASHAQQRL